MGVRCDILRVCAGLGRSLCDGWEIYSDARVSVELLLTEKNSPLLLGEIPFMLNAETTFVRGPTVSVSTPVCSDGCAERSSDTRRVFVVLGASTIIRASDCVPGVGAGNVNAWDGDRENGPAVDDNAGVLGAVRAPGLWADREGYPEADTTGNSPNVAEAEYREVARGRLET